MTNSLSLRQCHFSKQYNLLFSKYFEQIFSSPVNQIRDAFSLYLNTVQKGSISTGESELVRIYT